MGGIISVTTDFGTKDPYVGIMKGIMLTINPAATVVDITHGVEHGDIVAGALALESAFGYFPSGTIHLAVVDPGVGGSRRPIAVKTRNYSFVGPDNGLLSLAAELDHIVHVVELKNPEYFLDDICMTFHGRDIFSPVAAHLSLDKDSRNMGDVIKGLKTISLAVPEKADDTITGEIIYIDTFGNLITNIGRLYVPADLEREAEVAVRGIVIKSIVDTYSSVEVGSLASLFGSTKRLEVACNMDSAAKVLGAHVGDNVVVRLKSGSTNG